MEAPDIRIAFYEITKGKPFTHNGTVYEKYMVNEDVGKILLYPQGSRIASEIYFDSAESFLKQVNKAKNNSQASLQIKKHRVMDDHNKSESLPEQASSFLTKEDMKVTINDLKNILMGTIERVQDDAEYCSQANSVNQSVNTLINLAKLSMQLMKNV